MVFTLVDKTAGTVAEQQTAVLVEEVAVALTFVPVALT